MKIEATDLLDHVSSLLFGQLGINGKCQSIAGRRFSVWQVASTVAEISKALLHMQRHWIVNFRLHPLLAQESLESIAIRAANDELIVNMSWTIFRQHDLFDQAG